MEFTEAVRSVLGKYATFTGRAPRSEFWWWTLFVFLLSIATQIVDGFLFGPVAYGGVPPLSLLVSLGVFLPGLTVSVRRLHDLDRTGWWLLIIFVPLVGVLLLLFWFVQRGTVGANSHGEDPLPGARFE